MKIRQRSKNQKIVRVLLNNYKNVNVDSTEGMKDGNAGDGVNEMDLE